MEMETKQREMPSKRNRRVQEISVGWAFSVVLMQCFILSIYHIFHEQFTCQYLFTPETNYERFSVWAIEVGG
jgi:hypothetical protein